MRSPSGLLFVFLEDCPEACNPEARKRNRTIIPNLCNGIDFFMLFELSILRNYAILRETFFGSGVGKIYICPGILIPSVYVF